jgi:putative hemolysin
VEAILGSLGILLIVFLFCVTILDISLRSVQYHKIRSLYRRGNPKAARLLKLLSSPDQAISVLLFLRYSATASLFLIVGSMIYAFDAPQLYKAIVYPLLVIVFLILLEYVPRMLAVHNPERAAFALVSPFELILKLNKLIPLPQMSERLASRFLRLYGFNGKKIFSEYSVNEIKMFLNAGRKKSEAEIRRQTIDYRIFEFNGHRVREVMTARPMVKALDVNTRLDVALLFMQENGYSRVPVFRGNLDNILGILNFKDIIGVFEPGKLDQYLRKPFFIPKSATVQAAFQTMRRNRAHLAIVVDEYGGVDGIVTLEDLIEELIGEIQDEYDDEQKLLQQVKDDTWIIEGNLPIKELNQNLNLDLPEDSSYTTVAGFMISQMDKIPSENDQLNFGNLQFSVEKMSGNQIAKISLHIPPPSSTDASVL